MHIHARGLIYFDMIRRTASIREAARRLHVASSSVNRQLLQIEAEVGAPLFERMQSGLKLTAAGEVFSMHVITVLQDEQRMRSELEMLRGVRRGSVSLMSVEALNADLLPACLDLMRQRYRTIGVRALSGGSAQTALAVAEGEVDIAIGFSLERNDALRQCAVGRFEIGAVVKPDHPLAHRPFVTFADCAKHPLILPALPLSIYGMMKPLLAHYKRAMTVCLETSSLELAKSMVLRGLGVAFQTRLGLERDIDEGRLAFVPLRAEITLKTELGVYVRAGRTLPTAVDALIRIAAEEIERREMRESE